jgi:hypothetical protein
VDAGQTSCRWLAAANGLFSYRISISFQRNGGATEMSEPWAASMSGVPWNTDKMNSAVKQLRNRATIGFVVEQELNRLGAMDRMEFLKIRSPKTQNLDFIRNYKFLKYLTQWEI